MQGWGPVGHGDGCPEGAGAGSAVRMGEVERAPLTPSSRAMALRGQEGEARHPAGPR